MMLVVLTLPVRYCALSNCETFIHVHVVSFWFVIHVGHLRLYMYMLFLFCL